MQGNYGNFKSLRSLRFGSPADSVSFGQCPTWQPTCVASKELLQKALYMASPKLCSALPAVQSLLVGSVGRPDHGVYRHTPSQQWVRRVFAHPRKLYLECNSTVIISVAFLPPDFVYRKRGVPSNSAKIHQTLLHICFKGSVGLTAALFFSDKWW